MDKVEKSLDSVIESLMVVWNKYSEPVADATLHLIRIEHLFYLVFGVLVVVGCVCAWRALSMSYKSLNEALKEEYSIGYATALLFLKMTVLLMSLGTFLNFQYWLAIYDPKLYLLRKVIGKVLYE